MTVEEIKVVCALNSRKAFATSSTFNCALISTILRKSRRQSAIFSKRKKHDFITTERSQLKQISALKSA